MAFVCPPPGSLMLYDGRNFYPVGWLVGCVGGTNGFTAAPSPVHANQRLPVFGGGFVPQPDASGWWSSDHANSPAFGPIVSPFGHPYPFDQQNQFSQQHPFGLPQATRNNLLDGVTAGELATLAADFPPEPVFPSSPQFNPVGSDFPHGFGSGANGVDFNGPAANTVWPTHANSGVQYPSYLNPSAPAQAFFANGTASHGATNNGTFSGHMNGPVPSCNTSNTFAGSGSNANTIGFPHSPSLASTPSSHRHTSTDSGPPNPPAAVSAPTPSPHRHVSAQLGPVSSRSSSRSFTRSASMPSKPGIFASGAAKGRSSFLGHFAASPSPSSRAATPCPPHRRQSGPGYVRDQSNAPPSSASPSSTGRGSLVAPQHFNVSSATQSTLASEPSRSLSVPSPNPQPVHDRVGASAPASPFVASAQSLPTSDQSFPISQHAHSLPASPFTATSNKLPLDDNAPLPLEDGPDPGFNPNDMMLGVDEGPDWSGDEPTNTEQPMQEANPSPGPNTLQTNSHPAAPDVTGHLYVYVRDKSSHSVANIPTTDELAKKRSDVFRNIVDRAPKRRAGASDQAAALTVKSKAMSAVMSTSILWDLVSVAPWSMPDSELLEKASNRACEATGYGAENITSEVRVKITESISRLRGDTIYVIRPVVTTCMKVSPAKLDVIEILLTNDQFLYPSREMIPTEYFLADIVGEVLANLLFYSAKKLGLVFMEELLREDNPEILQMVLAIAGLANDDHPPTLADSSPNATIGPSIGLLAFAAISIYHSLTLIAAGDDDADKEKDSKEKKARFTEAPYQSMWTSYVCELAQHPRLGDVRRKALTRIQDEYCSLHPPRGKRRGADRAW